MRLAFLSDIHEDLKRLRRILKKIERKGCDMCICLGDISGFNDSYYSYRKKRNASACLDLVRKKCEIIIPGNHDLYAAGRIPEKPAESGIEYWPHEEDLEPGYGEEDIAFLAGLPEYAVLPTPEYKILLSHYIDPNLSGFIKGFYSQGKEFTSHFGLMQKLRCKIGFSGHAHTGGFYTVDPQRYKHYGYRRLHVKDFPVVVGIPPVTSHRNRSGFCIFDTNSNLLQVYKLF